MVKRKIHVIFILFLVLAVSIMTSVEIANNSYAKTFDPLNKSLGTVSKSNYKRCIVAKGTYTLSVSGRGKVASVVYNVSYIPNKYISKEIKNLKSAKVNEGVSFVAGLVPHVGAALSLDCMYANNQIDGMISKLQKIKKSGKHAKITLYKTSGNPASYRVASWDGKTIMKKSYKYVKNKSTHKMVVKKSDIKYGKK